MRTLLTVLLVSFLVAARAQLNDIMITEYVDWNPGSGWAVKIYNPTSQAINLAAYEVRVFNGANTTASASRSLSGILPAQDVLVLGNALDAQASSDFKACFFDLSFNAAGVNDDDCIAITRGGATNFIDMVGLHGASARVQVSGSNNALLHHKLVRNSGNCRRYTSTDGVSPNSWPSSAASVFPGWTAQAVQCVDTQSRYNPYRLLPLVDSLLCQGDSLRLFGQWVSKPGLYRDTAVTSNFCREISQVNLRLQTPPVKLDTLRKCPGDTQVVSGQLLTSDTTIFYTDTNAGTCDTLFQLAVRNEVGPAGLTYTYLSEDSTRLRFVVEDSLVNHRYRWQPEADTIYEGTQATFTYAYDSAGLQNILLTVISPDGCEYRLQKQFIIPEPATAAHWPNVFTPNGDGRNDYFQYPVASPASNWRITIYNRLGTSIFSANSPDFKWDGQYQGRPLPDGVYYYIYTDGSKSGKGFITLVR